MDKNDKITEREKKGGDTVTCWWENIITRREKRSTGIFHNFLVISYLTPCVERNLIVDQCDDKEGPTTIICPPEPIV